VGSDGAPGPARALGPAETHFDYVEAGATLDELLRKLPRVTREQVLAVLESAKRMAAGEGMPA
jgi:uncharacterized protein (DUF433 family)